MPKKPSSHLVIDRYKEDTCGEGWRCFDDENYIDWKIVCMHTFLIFFFCKWITESFEAKSHQVEEGFCCFYEISRVNPLDIFISSQEKEDSSSNLSEFNCPEILVTQQWIDKKGRAKKTFLSCRKCLRNLWCMQWKLHNNKPTFLIYIRRACMFEHTQKRQ